MASTASELVSQAKAQVENLTPEQVAEEIRRGVLVVDLREPGELANDGMIADALHAPRGMLEFWADPSSPYHRPEFDPRRRTVLYCASGGRSVLGTVTLGMSLEAGGHLTHGFRSNISGKLFEQRSYGVDPTSGLIDYDALRALAREFRPLIIVAGYSAYPRNPNFALIREIADEVEATLLVDMAHFAGLVAGGILTGDLNPIGHAQVITSTTHKSLRGPRGGLVLCTRDLAEFVDRGCPMVLGGPLPHVMAAKAVALPKRANHSSPPTRNESSRTRMPSLTPCAAGTSASSRAAPTTT